MCSKRWVDQHRRDSAEAVKTLEPRVYPSHNGRIIEEGGFTLSGVMRRRSRDKQGTSEDKSSFAGEPCHNRHETKAKPSQQEEAAVVRA